MKSRHGGYFILLKLRMRGARATCNSKVGRAGGVTRLSRPYRIADRACWHCNNGRHATLFVVTRLTPLLLLEKKNRLSAIYSKRAFAIAISPWTISWWMKMIISS